MPASRIDTVRRDAIYRPRVVDTTTRSVLVSRIRGTAQEQDLSSPTNCDGYGRVRHFRKDVAPHWPENPLPIVPAARWLGVTPPSMMEAQVFQIAACAWRCWYCYVPFASLRADLATSAWRTADALVDDYLNLGRRPPIIDLSGGSPDLAPEWIAWTLEAVERRGAAGSTFVWSDDNLSSDRLVAGDGRVLANSIASFPNYGRACCLKGYDGPSFAFNTMASPDGFDRQLAILAAYAATALDIYVYLPLVGPAIGDPRMQIERILDLLSSIRTDLPARTIPLFISRFGSMAGRVDPVRDRALDRQWDLVEHWAALAPARSIGS